MSKTFPKFATDSAVRCFNCGGECQGHRESGYAPKRGERVADCSVCRMSTWYDIKQSLKNAGRNLPVIDAAMSRLFSA